MIRVPNKKILNSLQNKKEGELALVEDPRTYFVVKDGEWVETDEYECVLEEYENMKEL